jgi:cytochrome b subunit of formate dehydrogenase
MSPALARPLLHTVHLATFLALLVTGLLLLVPGLRAAVTGGYSLLIRETHRWGGVAFTVLPVAIVAGAGARTVFVAHSQRTARTLWQGTHVALTVAMGVVFTVTGFVLWGKQLAPDAIVDVSRLAHDWLTYAAAVLVVAHLLEVGLAAVVGRITAATTQQSET